MRCARREKRARGGGTSPLARLAAAAILGLAVQADRAHALDLNAEADLGAGTDQNSYSGQTYLRQLYQLRYARNVSEPLSYRLGVLYQDDQGQIRLPDREGRQHSYEVIPQLYAAWMLEGFSLQVASSVDDGSYQALGMESPATRRIQRHSAATRVRILQDADLHAYVTHLGYTGTDIDNARDTVGLGFDWRYEGLRLENTNVVDRYDDVRNQVVRSSLGPRVALSYARASTDWTAAARYELEYSLIEQTSHGLASSLVPSDFRPQAGLYVVDSFPADTAPMPSEPRLIDGALDVSAGVDVGPGGASFQNVGIDMGRTITLDELILPVRSSTGQAVPFGGPVSWSVWTSTDGIRWAAVPGVTATFSTGMSAYVLAFNSTQARFFKAVNFGVNTVETFVTEMQPFVKVPFAQDRTVGSHTVRNTLWLDTSVPVFQGGRVTYSGRFHRDALTDFAGNSLPSSDVTNTLVLTLTPPGPFRVDLTGIQYDAKSAYAPDWSRVGGLAAATYKPFERLSTRAEGRYLHEGVNHVVADTVGGNVQVNAVVFDTLLATATADYAHQVIREFGTVDHLTTNADVVSNLTQNFELRFTGSAQRTVSETGTPEAGIVLAPVLQTQVFQRYYFEPHFRRGPQLDLFGRVGWARTPATEGTIWKAAVVWQPFPGGSLQLTLDYDTDIDPLSGHSYRRYGGQIQWNLNTHASFWVRYNDIMGWGGTPYRQKSATVYLTLTL